MSYVFLAEMNKSLHAELIKVCTSRGVPLLHSCYDSSGWTGECFSMSSAVYKLLGDSLPKYQMLLFVLGHNNCAAPRAVRKVSWLDKWCFYFLSLGRSRWRCSLYLLFRSLQHCQPEGTSEPFPKACSFRISDFITWGTGHGLFLQKQKMNLCYSENSCRGTLSSIQLQLGIKGDSSLPQHTCQFSHYFF